MTSSVTSPRRVISFDSDSGTSRREPNSSQTSARRCAGCGSSRSGSISISSRPEFLIARFSARDAFVELVWLAGRDRTAGGPEVLTAPPQQQLHAQPLRSGTRTVAFGSLCSGRVGAGRYAPGVAVPGFHPSSTPLQSTQTGTRIPAVGGGQVRSRFSETHTRRPAEIGFDLVNRLTALEHGNRVTAAALAVASAAVRHRVEADLVTGVAMIEEPRSEIRHYAPPRFANVRPRRRGGAFRRLFVSLFDGGQKPETRPFGAVTLR